MWLPRIHLFELEDQPWFPAAVRDRATDYLHFIEARLALHRPTVALIAEVLRAAKASHIIDLCSGAGGPIPGVLQELETYGLKPTVTLTDRFPNVPSFERAAAAGKGVSFEPEPVDARAVPRNLHGMRTLFNAFHHFRPEHAIDVLRDAAKAGEPIGIFEIPDRSLRTLVPTILLTPWMVALTTLFMRPFDWPRFLWTYLLPLVPLTCWWDGIISHLRAYSPAELSLLAEKVGVPGYQWRAGKVPIGSVPGYMTYLIGYPNR